MRNHSAQQQIYEDSVVQRYVHNPLLIGKKKHDLRLYLLIARVEPFVAFLNEEGLARFCTEDYDSGVSSKQEKFQLNKHLTNYSVNKSSKQFVYTSELTEENEGSKRTLASYWKSVEREGKNPAQVS